MSVTLQDFKFTDLFMEMMLDWNEGGTRNLILRGNDLSKKVGRRIQDGDVLRITAFLSKHPEVVSLELPYNEIGNCGVYNLMEHFKTHPNVKYLNLMGNEITGTGVKYITALKEKLPFYVLRLNGNKIGDKGGIYISKLFYLNVPLKILDISDCQLTMSGLAHVFTGLMRNRGGKDTLEIIDVGRPLPQYLHQIPDEHAAEFIGQVLHRNSGLQEFHAQQYQFDFRDIEILVDGLMMNKSLKLLDLNNNNIGDDGVAALCTYLRTSPPLGGLMIGSNNFGDKGARSLSFNLPYSNVTLLDVSNNHITDTGILDILYSLRKTVPMKGLFLWGNTITHKSLVLVNLFLTEGVLTSENLDISVYFVDDRLKAARNSSANMYTQRYYGVSGYGHPPMRRVTKNPPRPEAKPEIPFKHHVDDKVLGLPLYGPYCLKN